MYELLTGKHPFAADSFSRLIHMIINEKHPPLSTYRTDIPEILEKIIHHALQKDPERRYKMGLNFAGDLSLAFDYLEEPQQDVEVQEKFNSVQPLSFFSEFPESEIWEIIHACIWQTYEAGNQIIVEGDIDDSFYIIISGEVDVNKDGALIGNLKTGDCFGEMAYLSKSERTATILAKNNVSLMKVNATLIEQVSVECQLHFSKVFMRTLVKRLSDTTAMYASSQE
jgi:serine/threonine protein kinase